MEDKYESFKQKILKLNELALRGEEGEALNARKAMDRLCSNMGVNLEDILNDSQQKEWRIFNVGCDSLLKELFFKCCYKVMGNEYELWYKELNSHISIELTPSQYAEISSMFDWHKANFKSELKAVRKRLFLAYCLKHNIYNDSVENSNLQLSPGECRDAKKILNMVNSLEDVSYLKGLEDK